MSDRNTTQDVDQPVEATPPAGSTIPEGDAGVAVGYTGDPSTFEPEEVAPTAAATVSPRTEDATGGTGPRSTEATAMTGEDLSIFKTHWDEFAGHVD